MLILWNMIFEKCEFCENWDFRNVNFVTKNDISEMWILWKLRFQKGEFCQKWDFRKVNFVKNEISERWILEKFGFLPQRVPITFWLAAHQSEQTKVKSDKTLWSKLALVTYLERWINSMWCKNELIFRVHFPHPGVVWDFVVQ